MEDSKKEERARQRGQCANEPVGDWCGSVTVRHHLPPEIQTWDRIRDSGTRAVNGLIRTIHQKAQTLA